MGYGSDIGFRSSYPLGCVRSSCQFDVTTLRGLAELKKHCFEVIQTCGRSGIGEALDLRGRHGYIHCLHAGGTAGL